MDDPEVRQWIEQREQPPASPDAAPTLSTATMTADMTAPVMAVRHHIMESLAAVPNALPDLKRVGGLLHAEIVGQGVWETLLLVAVFLGLGILLERIYWRATTGYRQRLIAMPLDTVEARLRAVGRQLAFGLGWTASFAIGSLGAFLLFDWPPLLHGLIARVLLVVVVVWLTTIILRFVLAPGAERFRILPMSTASARHWYLWLTIAVGWYTAAHLIHWFLADLGVSQATQILVADAFSLVWLGILLLALWRRPALRPSENSDAAALAAARLQNVLLTCGLVLIWLLVPLGATLLFYTAVMFLGSWRCWASPTGAWRISCGLRIGTGRGGATAAGRSPRSGAAGALGHRGSTVAGMALGGRRQFDGV